MRNCKCGAANTNNINMCDTCIEAEAVQIGSIKLSAATEITRSEESAAAYHVLCVEPGAYPVLLKLSRFDGRRYVAVQFTGKVLASGYGAKRYHDKVGTIDTVTEQPYKYQLRSGNWRGGKVEITDEAALDRAYGV